MLPKFDPAIENDHIVLITTIFDTRPLLVKLLKRDSFTKHPVESVVRFSIN